MPLRYRPEVDGLRAIAVCGVVLYHLGLGLPGGYVGVDVFFVISGYLITLLLLRELASNGTISLAQFWERRFRRLTPALVTMALVTAIAGWFILLPADYSKFGQSLCALSTFSANLFFWRKTGYFGGSGTYEPLLHTWSLAVEEQFYLLFPVFILMTRNRQDAYRMRVFCGCTVASYAFNIALTYLKPKAAFFLLPARMWELSLGSVLAQGPNGPKSLTRYSSAFSFLGLCCVLYSMLAFNDQTVFPGLAAALPCCGAAMIIRFSSPTGNAVGRMLSTKPIRGIGLISYSLYLWHWPVLALTRYSSLSELSSAMKIAALLGSVTLGYASWRLIEAPFRKNTGGRAVVGIAGGLASLGTMLSVGLTIAGTNGAPVRVTEQVYLMQAGISDREADREISLPDALARHYQPIGSTDVGLPIKFLVWGDSHAQSMIPAIDAVGRERGVRGVAATHSETPPLLGFKGSWGKGLSADTEDFNNEVFTFIKQQSIPDVILVAAWSGYPIQDAHCGLANTLATLTAAGARIWVVKDVPGQGVDVPRKLALDLLYRREPKFRGISTAEYKRQTASFEAVLANFPRATLIDPSAILCSDGVCVIEKGGRPLYRDSHHLTVWGSLQMKPIFEPVFDSKLIVTSQGCEKTLSFRNNQPLRIKSGTQWTSRKTSRLHSGSWRLRRDLGDSRLITALLRRLKT